MNRKDDVQTGRTRDDTGRVPAIDSQSLAIQALIFFASSPDQGRRFFDWSGLDAGSLRSAAVEPGFTTGLLDYFAQNLSSLESFCEAAGFDPGDVLRSYESLQPRGLTSHDDL